MSDKPIDYYDLDFPGIPGATPPSCHEERKTMSPRRAVSRVSRLRWWIWCQWHRREARRVDRIAAQRADAETEKT